MERIGRNDLCPCGSGKKYKRCCLPRETERREFADVLEAAAHPLLAKLARFAEVSAGAALETIAREEFPFWRGPLTVARGARIVDYLIFEHRPKHFGRRVVEQFAIDVGPTLSDAAQEILGDWVDAPRSFFETVDWSGGFTDCVDLLSETPQRISVIDMEGSWKPPIGEPVALRPLRVGPAYLCAGKPMDFTGRSPAEALEGIRRRHLDFVRRSRIVGIREFLRLAPTALDEEAARAPSSSTIIVPGS